MPFKFQCKLNFVGERAATVVSGAHTAKPFASQKCFIVSVTFWENILREMWMNQKYKQLNDTIATQHPDKNKYISHLKWNNDEENITFFFERGFATKEQPPTNSYYANGFLASGCLRTLRPIRNFLPFFSIPKLCSSSTWCRWIH